MEYRSVKGYEGLYEVNEYGSVRGVDRYIETVKGVRRFIKGMSIKPRINNYGYVELRLSKQGVNKTHFVHRLVAQAFIPNPYSLPQVNHLSGDKVDNNVTNLEWTDASGNAKHAYATGLNKQCGCTHTAASPVINTETGELFCSLKILAEYLGINYNSLRNALNGYQPFPKAVDLTGYNFEKYTC